MIQSTADEAKALRRHAETELGSHHSPDLFHGQHEVSKATSLPLARDVLKPASQPRRRTGRPSARRSRRSRRACGARSGVRRPSRPALAPP